MTLAAFQGETLGYGGAAVLRGRLSRRTGGLVVLSALGATVAALRALEEGPLER